MNRPSAPSTDVDALFMLPLGEFTSARNALAAQLGKAGRQPEASEVKALVKPSISAWVVNQLYWRHRGSFDRLIEAGDRLRRAQAAQLTGDSAREPVIARRAAVAALAALGTELLRDGNLSATRDLLRRVTTTLEALSSYGSLPGAPAAGRLTDDVEPPGFEAVTGLLPKSDERAARVRRRSSHAPAATKPPPRTNRPRTPARRDDEVRKGRVAAAKAAVREAERALSAARKEAERATAKLETAATRAKAIERQRAKMAKRFARASKDAESARQHASEAESGARAATQAVEGAERALERARRQLEGVTGEQE